MGENFRRLIIRAALVITCAWVSVVCFAGGLAALTGDTMLGRVAVALLLIPVGVAAIYAGVKVPDDGET